MNRKPAELTEDELTQVSGGAMDEQMKLFQVTLKDCGASHARVIKELTALLGLSLKEAKFLADSTPIVLKTDVPECEATKIKSALEKYGAIVELH